MPWRETSPMDQKTQFMADYLRDSLSITELCELYGISRKSGYKWIDRYLRHGPVGLEERSRKPRRSPNQTPEHVSAVVYAKLRRGDMKMAGFSIREKEFPGVKQAQSWSGLVEGWKAELAALAAGFAQGSAQVDPKRGLATCRYCDLKPLCRVHERLSALAEDGEERE